MKHADWTTTTLGEIASFKSGGTPSKQNEAFWGGQHPWISAKDLKTHYLSTSIDTLTDKGFAESKRAPLGSSLVLVRGMTLLKDFPVGYASKELAFNQDIKALVPKPGIDPLFLSYLLVSKKDFFLQNVSVAGHGTGKLETEILKELAVVIPPTTEQTKIAQVLSTWGKAIATTERLLANSQQQKKALMQQLLTGQKRFSEFHEEWRVANFLSLFLVKNDKKTQTTSSNYLEHGKTPIVDQGQALIAGYTDSNQVYRDVPVIVFGDHTRAIKWVDFEFSPGADGTQILKASDLLEARFAYYLLSNADIPNLGYSRHMRELKEIDFRYPTDKVEQQKIAQVLSTADAEIANLHAQLDKLKLEKKALMQQLLTGKRRVRLDDEEEDMAPIRRVG